VQVSEIVIFRIAAGKIIKAWDDYGEHGMRHQLAAPLQA